MSEYQRISDILGAMERGNRTDGKMVFDPSDRMIRTTCGGRDPDGAMVYTPHDFVMFVEP